MKPLVSCGTFIQNPKLIGQLRTVTKIFTRTFVIARHSCHRCIYILVTVIFAVVACKITFLIKTYLLSPFLIIFWWIWTFWDHVVFISTSKEFLRRTFQISFRQNINCTSFLLFLSYTFETFFRRMIINPQNVHFYLTECAFSLYLLEPVLLLSRLR